MNEAQVHLLFNHLPLGAVFFGICILAAGIFLKNSSVRLTAFSLLIFAGIITLPAFFSGEGAEEVLEALNDPAISHDLIHEHEEKAELALWLAEALAILGVVGFVLERKKHQFSSAFNWLMLLLAAGMMVVMAGVNHSGGLIRHPEIGNAAVAPAAASTEAEHESGEH